MNKAGKSSQSYDRDNPNYGIPVKPIEGITRYGPDVHTVYALVQELQKELERINARVKYMETKLFTNQPKD